MNLGLKRVYFHGFASWLLKLKKDLEKYRNLTVRWTCLTKIKFSRGELYSGKPHEKRKIAEDIDLYIMVAINYFFFNLNSKMFSTVLAIPPKRKLSEIIHRWACCILLSSISNLKDF